MKIKIGRSEMLFKVCWKSSLWLRVQIRMGKQACRVKLKILDLRTLMTLSGKTIRRN